MSSTYDSSWIFLYTNINDNCLQKRRINKYVFMQIIRDEEIEKKVAQLKFQSHSLNWNRSMAEYHRKNFQFQLYCR